MIVGSDFDGDTNRVLHRVQHDCYFGGYAGSLYLACRQRYLDSARLLGVSNAFTEALEELHSYDHRVL